jgi:NADH-quinone oxidoreductase subunit L
MEKILPVFLIIPLSGFLISLVLPRHHESLISWQAYIVTGLQQLTALVVVAIWIWSGGEPVNIKEFTIYKTTGYEFFIDLYFDRITAVYLVVGSMLTFLITVYSRYYLHREKGYKRFFNTILFFFFGYNLIIFSGNFETLFIGWEVLGVSSFLLIAFYRERYLPVRNAYKVFSYYRLGDICILLAMWMSHHLWHHNVTFLELNNYTVVEAELQRHYTMGMFISIMLLIAAAVKSAQVPFTSWLPRAMEGPTPSSAIFYSSLAVHIGVFMLLRTFPFWEHQFVMRWAIGILGLITSVMANLASKVQSSIKSQIAYSSASQIGLIFIEVALGLEVVALIHFAGNAFLRSYQLLVSPSVVTYLIREQLYNHVPTHREDSEGWKNKLRNTLYVISLKEWNLETLMFRYAWNPVKKFGKFIRSMSRGILLWISIPVFLTCFSIIYFGISISHGLLHALPVFLAIIALIQVIKAFTERKNVMLSWALVAFNHFWIALAISFNEHFSIYHTVLYLSGVTFSGIVGALVIVWLKRREPGVSLNAFQGHAYEYPGMSLIFLLACLGLAGFPITTTFLGEDLIISHIHENQLPLVLLVGFSLILDGLALFRMYARIFLGPHIKTYHETANRAF